MPQRAKRSSTPQQKRKAAPIEGGQRKRGTGAKKTPASAASRPRATSARTRAAAAAKR